MNARCKEWLEAALLLAAVCSCSPATTVKKHDGPNAVCVGQINECGVCAPSVGPIGVPCTATNGCTGTSVCSADGDHADCKTAISTNECGLCGGASISGLGGSCTLDDGRQGLSVCNASRDGTACAFTVVTLSFDDTFSDTLAAAPLLEQHGMRGMFYINSPRLIRGSRFMTLTDALNLQKSGHEIGGHTLHHPHLPTLPADEQKAELCNDRAQLISMGLDIRHFAYPFGEANSDTETAAQQCNYNSARGVGDLRDAHGNAIAAEAYAPPDLFRIRANSSIVDSDTLEEMQKRVLDAEMTGGWVIINMHHVCDTCGTTQVHPGILSAFLDWLAPRNANGTLVRTTREVVRGEMKPPVMVDGPGAPDTGITQNER